VDGVGKIPRHLQPLRHQTKVVLNSALAGTPSNQDIPKLSACDAMAMEGGNVSWGNQSTSEVLCDLTEGYSFVLQSILGFLAFSTLIREWTRMRS